MVLGLSYPYSIPFRSGSRRVPPFLVDGRVEKEDEEWAELPLERRKKEEKKEWKKEAWECNEEM